MESPADQFCKILKYTGMSGNVTHKGFFEWMFQDECGHNYSLLHWMVENITTENALSKTEQREYAELCKRGELLSGDDLDKAVEDLVMEYPDLFNSQDEEHLIEMIDATNKQADLLEKHIIQLNSVNSDTANITKKQISSDVRLKCAIDTCKDVAIDLHNEEKGTTDSLQQIHQYYDCAAYGPSFITQIPFEDFYKSIDLYLSYYNMYVKRQFESSNIGMKKDSDKLREETELKRLWDSLYVSIVDESLLKCENESCKITVNRMMTKTSDTLPLNMNLEIERLYAEIRFQQEENELFKYTVLPAAVRNYVNLYIKNIIYEENKQKMERRKLRLSKLRKLHSSLHDMLVLSEFVGLLLQGDLQRVLDLQEIEEYWSSRINNNSIDLPARANLLLKMIEEQNRNDEIPVTELPWSICLTHILRNDVPRNMLSLDPLQQYNQFLNTISQTEKTIFEGQFNQYKEALDKLEENNKQFDAAIYRDITSQPIVISPARYPLYHSSLELVPLQIKLEAEINNYQQKMESAKTLTNETRRLLWIWFLTDPKNVISAIANLRNQVQGSGRTTVGLRF